MSELRLLDLIDRKVLQRIQDGFSQYTGMASITTDVNGIPVTEGSGFTQFCTGLTRRSEKGRALCEKCDRMGAFMTLQEGKPAVYPCHTGMTDFAAPIMVEGNVIGSFVGGQVRTGELNEAALVRKARELEIDPEVYIAAAEQIPILPKEQIEHAARFLAELAAVLSDMAYNSYVDIQRSKALERAARSQTNCMMSMNHNLQESMQRWMDQARQALASGSKEDMEHVMKQFAVRGMEILSMIEDTVEFTRMTNGEVELSEKRYNIRAFVSYMMEGIRKRARDWHIEYTVKIDEDVPEFLLGDSGRIGQILSKLLLNIRQQEARAVVETAIACERKSYATVLIVRICDRAGVMNREQLNRIHEFASGEGMMISEADFQGLGFLVIGHQVRQMSGTIRTEETEDGGVCITLRLPQLELKD